MKIVNVACIASRRCCDSSAPCGRPSPESACATSMRGYGDGGPVAGLAPANRGGSRGNAMGTRR
eukprot:77498-Pyramimonas_sp.AAC.1